jgi:hypothetical protein
VDDAPDSPSRERELADALAALLQRDDSLRDEIARLVATAQGEGVQLSGPISQSASGSGPTNQLAGNIHDVNITQH